MKKAFKKLTAFILAMGLMTTSMTTVHASGYSYIDAPDEIERFDNVVSVDLSKNGYRFHNGDGFYVYDGIEPPSTAKAPADNGTYAWFNHYVYNSATGNYEYAGDYYWDGSQWMRDGGKYSWDERYAAVTDGGASGDNGNNTSNANNVDKKALLAALAEQAAAEEAGFATVASMNAAAERNMSAFEYYNNMIINTPGIEKATPVGQSGKLIINGKESGMTFTFNKVVDRSYVDSVRSQTDGTVLNVVNIGLPLADGIAVITTNFYMPGVAAGDEITVLQYVNGAWVEIAVSEIRADHVVLNLERSGIIAFIRK